MRNILDERPTTEQHGGLLYAQRFVSAADVRDRDVLDIGCGFGWFEVHALSLGVKAVTGIEPTEPDLATARRHVSDSRASFFVAGATELPFPDASFDTVVMWEVLEHIPRDTEPRAFAEIERVLRPGGRLYLSTPHASLAARVTDPAWWVAGHRHYTPGRLCEFAAEARLEVEALELRGRTWQIVHMNNMYVSKWILRRRPLFEQASLRILDRSWLRGSGFTNIFLRCRRP